MKKALVLIFLIVSSLAFGQTKIKVSRKTALDKETIGSARIGKYLGKMQCIPHTDSCWSIVYRSLTTEQVNYFADQWNNAIYLGEKRIKPDYCIELLMKDGTQKVIRLNNSLNEKNNYQFSIEDKKFLKNLWGNAIKE